MSFEQLERQGFSLAGAEEKQRGDLDRRDRDQQDPVTGGARKLAQRGLVRLADAAAESRRPCDDRPAGGALSVDQPSLLNGSS